MNIDMTKCKPGDKAKLRNGTEAVYLRRNDDLVYKHILRDSENNEFSVTNEGAEWVSRRFVDRDVVEILSAAPVPTCREIIETEHERLQASVKAAAERFTETTGLTVSDLDVTHDENGQYYIIASGHVL